MTEYIVDFGSMAMLARIIESQSANLREKIVRCRDCKYADPEPPSDRRSRKKYQGGYWCDYWSEGIGAWCEPDGFCAWAIKRKEGGDD